jgi:hypothetical protein
LFSSMSAKGQTRKDRSSGHSFQSFAISAWNIAAIQTASSTRVQMSQSRNLSVG